MIRRAFLRRFGLGAAAVAVSPLDAFKLPEVVPWRFSPEPEVGDLLVQTDLGELTRLVHEIYADQVVPFLTQESAVNKIFHEAYPVPGEKLVFPVNVS